MKTIGDHQLCARTDALFSNDSKKSYRPALFHFFNTSRLSCYNSRLMSMLSQDFTNCLELTNVFFVMLKHFGQLSKRLPHGQRKQLLRLYSKITHDCNNTKLNNSIIFTGRHTVLLTIVLRI